MRKKGFRIASALIVISIAGTAWAADLLVPQQFATIQSAIDVATDGSRIVVSPGTYRENLLIEQRSISLVSTNGAEQTILDGQAKGPVVAARGSGVESLTLMGFTVTNGFSTFDTPSPGAGSGGGIHLMELKTASISDNVIRGNVGCLGSGIAASSTTVSILRNRINDNIQDASCNGASGGGIFFNADAGSPSSIAGNEIARNRIGGTGAGIYANAPAGVTIANNRIADNIAGAEAGGGILINSSSADIVGNVITGNVAGYGGGIAVFPDTPNLVRVARNWFESNRGSEGSAAHISVFDARSIQFDHNAAYANSPDPLIYCAIQPIRIRKNNILVNPGGAEVGGTCIR